VIKVENPHAGDAARGWGPPFADDAATCFHAVNRAKKGITVDLADLAAVEKLKRLIINRADVLVHNLKFGALDRYDLSAEALLAAKPSLVYCNLGAFGAVGPMRERPGYDPLMQAYGGLMSLMGEDGRPPVRVGVSIVDLATGMWAAIGILAALAERRRTGIGGVIDTSLYESALAWMTIPIAAYLVDRKIPSRQGSGVEMIVPYQAFAAADGYLMVAAGNDNLFRRLSGVIARPELAGDPRFRTNKDRVVNRAALIGILDDIFVEQPKAVWQQRLDAAGIPNGPLQTVDQVVADPQTRALGIIQELATTPSTRIPLSLVGLPLSFDGVRPPFAKAAPALGEDLAALDDEP
jgi:crotonobetainyl-CoA:carnitine CoA-transferase CaiB-like acyl-CoA transferase